VREERRLTLATCPHADAWRFRHGTVWPPSLATDPDHTIWEIALNGVVTIGRSGQSERHSRICRACGAANIGLQPAFSRLWLLPLQRNRNRILLVDNGVATWWHKQRRIRLRQLNVGHARDFLNTSGIGMLHQQGQSRFFRNPKLVCSDYGPVTTFLTNEGARYSQTVCHEAVDHLHAEVLLEWFKLRLERWYVVAVLHLRKFIERRKLRSRKPVRYFTLFVENIMIACDVISNFD
jgi:hypothetical protein